MYTTKNINSYLVSAKLEVHDVTNKHYKYQNISTLGNVWDISINYKIYQDLGLGSLKLCSLISL